MRPDNLYHFFNTGAILTSLLKATRLDLIAVHFLSSNNRNSCNDVYVYVITVLTYCEVHCIPAVLYVCYTRSHTIDSTTVMAFRHLRQSAPLADIIIVSIQMYTLVLYSSF